MRFFILLLFVITYPFLLCTTAQAKVYVQYDPTQADASGHVYISTVNIPDRHDGKNPPAPQPPSNITQIELPDGTDVNNKMLDLSGSTPELIDIPSPSSSSSSSAGAAIGNGS